MDDELMSPEVTSVSKKEQRLADTSAAIFAACGGVVRRRRGAAPRHQAQLRASASLPVDVAPDLLLLATGRIPELGVAAWTRLDTRLAWQVRPPVELSFSIQNVLNRRHREFAGGSSTVVQFSDVPRTAYGAVTWRL